MRFVAVAALASLLPASFSGSNGLAVAPSTHELREVHRIRAHFDGALDMLASRDISTLTASQRTNRARMATTLAAYRDRGAFPRNYDFGATPTPYFVDRNTGVLCAVAHLMESTGRRDIVDRVAAMDNNVWVGELAGDAEFRGWLDEHGLTLAEAARIQVPYVGEEPPIPAPTPAAPSSLVRTSNVAAGTSLAFALLNTSLNRGGTSRLGSQLGYAAGAVTLGAGIAAFTSSGRDGRNAALAVSLASGTLSILAARRSGLEYRARTTRIAPILPIGPESGAGLSLSLTF